MQYYTTHESDGQRIADNNYKTFHERYLTSAAIACYWRRLFAAWANVQGFEPQLYERNDYGERILRGLPFEAYALDAEQPMPDI
jgi:protein glucosyltransferase